MKTSETVIIKRSQIQIAPYNPRKKNDIVVKKLIKNFKNVGFLGGIVWNSSTGILVSGHKRLEALDIINKYSSGKDYEIKVEKIELDIQSEKEQNIFMNASDNQGEFDNDILAVLLNDINIENTGIEECTLQQISIECPELNYHFDFKDTIKLSDQGLTEEELSKKRKEKRQERAEIQDKINNSKFDKPYIVITFDTFEDKAFVCEQFKLDQFGTYFKGIEIFKDILE